MRKKTTWKGLNRFRVLIHGWLCVHSAHLWQQFTTIKGTSVHKCDKLLSTQFCESNMWHKISPELERKWSMESSVLTKPCKVLNQPSGDVCMHDTCYFQSINVFNDNSNNIWASVISKFSIDKYWSQLYRRRYHQIIHMCYKQDNSVIVHLSCVILKIGQGKPNDGLWGGNRCE